MIWYEYGATRDDGTSFAGSIEAADLAGALALIQQEGVTIQWIHPTERGVSAASPVVEVTDWLPETQELRFAGEQAGSLEWLKSGKLPMGVSLRALAAGMPEKSFANWLKRVAARIDLGEDLLTACRAIPCGRETGRLAALIERGSQTHYLLDWLVEYLEIVRLRNRVVREVFLALLYPLLMLLTCGVLVFFLCVVVLPQFENIFESFDTSLPGLTKFVLAVGSCVRWWLQLDWYAPLRLLAVALAVLLPAWWLISSQAGRSVLYYLPVLGPILQIQALAEFCRILSRLVAANEPLPQALLLSAQLNPDPQLAHSARLAAGQLELGAAINEGENRGNLFPEAVQQALERAQSPRSLSLTLRGMSEYYNASTERCVAPLTSLFEPLLMLSVAFTVGLFVISMFLPLITLMNVLA